MSPRPGFVLDVDRSTPPTLFWHGERFSLERLPEGSRVIYAPEPIEPLKDPSAAIRAALSNPLGDQSPLPALLRPGMRLTIAFDDISLPLPPMERPDIRQMVIEQVLDMAADAGVDDVALIVALALHRRMTEAELRHAVGDRIYDAFAPNGLLTQHDAEDPDALVHLGLTDQGEDVEINRRAAESDLLVYVNINLVAMDGGHKSVATGLASYKSLRHHHNPLTMQQSRSFMDQHRSELHSSNWRMGRLIADSGVERLPDRDHPQQRHLPPCVPLPPEAGVGVEGQGPAGLPGRVQRPRPDAGPLRPPDLPLGEGTPPDDLGPGRRGRGGAQGDHRQRLGPAGCGGRGPDRHLDHGPPLHQPVQRELDPQPDPGGLPRPRLPVQHVPGQAAGARGRRPDHDPPHAVGVQPGPPPQLHRLLRTGAERDHRSHRGGRAVRGVVRHRSLVHPPLPDRARLPRRAPVLHVVLVRARPPAPRRGRRSSAATPPRCTGSGSGPPPPWPTPSRWPTTWSAPLPA